MKTPFSSFKTSGSNHSRLLKLLGVLFILGSLASCSTSSKNNSETSAVTFQRNHWHKVRSNPPTYFPKGVPADHPTGFSDGSWVHSGDKAKTSYFIPAHGVATKSLVAEAMTTMTPDRERELDERGAPDIKDSFGKAFKGGVLGLGGALMALDEHIYRSTGRATKGGAIHDAQNQQ